MGWGLRASGPLRRKEGGRAMRALTGGKILTPEGFREGWSLLYDHRIRDVVRDKDLPGGVERVEARGLWVCPGFIDLHVHGARGVDVMDATPEAVEALARSLGASGVTSFLATTMTMPLPRIVAALGAIREALGAAPGGARILGAHLEGPFIDPGHKGAQDAAHVLPPDGEFIKAHRDVIRIVTLAPERDPGFRCLDALRASGVVFSLGHSGATFEEALEGVAHGIRHATHLFNAMPPFHHRRPGPVGAALVSDDVTCELIADGVHVHPGLYPLIYRLKGPHRLVLVSDAMRGGGLGEGVWDLGGQQVTVRGGEARLADGTIAGSVLTLDRALRNFREGTGLSLEEMMPLTSGNAARVLGMDHRLGRVAPGYDADLVLLDDEGVVRRTVVGGETIYDAVDGS